LTISGGQAWVTISKDQAMNDPHAQVTIDGITYDLPYDGEKIVNTTGRTIPAGTPIYFVLPTTALKQMLEERAKDHCTCHPRDSSYVCDYCYKQGHRGHMQKGQ
jgi:hypothetical protein